MSRIRTNKSCIAGTGRWMGLLALVLTATLSRGQSSKLSNDLQAATSTNVDVVIQYAYAKICKPMSMECPK